MPEPSTHLNQVNCDKDESNILCSGAFAPCLCLRSLRNKSRSSGIRIFWSGYPDQNQAFICLFITYLFEWWVPFIQLQHFFVAVISFFQNIFMASNTWCFPKMATMMCLVSSTMWSCQPSSFHPTKSWRGLWVHPFESGKALWLLCLTEQAEVTLVPVSASCLLETTYPVRIMVSLRTHIVRRLEKLWNIRCYGEREKKKTDWKRTIGQRELRCQIYVLGNNVSVFIVLLRQGFMSKDCCGWGRGIAILRKRPSERLRDLFPQGHFFTNGDGLRAVPKTFFSPQREFCLSFSMSLSAKGRSSLYKLQ